ncbi:hypothetical protein IJT10_02815 [bacterium]|nr:hypothetical protein [bacterium]
MKNNILRGQTLIEMLITCTLFFIIFVMIGNLFVDTVRADKLSQDKVQDFRSLSVTLEEIARELRFCEKINWPNSAEINWREGGKYANGRDGFTFIYTLAANSRGRKFTKSLIYDPKSKILYRITYKSGFIPDISNCLSSKHIILKRVLGRDIEGLSITSNDTQKSGGRYFLKISLKGSEELRTQVQVKGVL